MQRAGSLGVTLRILLTTLDHGNLMNAPQGELLKEPVSFLQETFIYHNTAKIPVRFKAIRIFPRCFPIFLVLYIVPFYFF